MLLMALTWKIRYELGRSAAGALKSSLLLLTKEQMAVELMKEREQQYTEQSPLRSQIHPRGRFQRKYEKEARMDALLRAASCALHRSCCCLCD